MANKKINQLVSKTSILSTDLFGIGDATTGQLFKKTIAELQAAIGGAVISVNGLVGTVVLDTDDIQELATPTNKYFTDARARAAISLTVTGNSGASTYSSGTGVLNVPTYTLAGLGGITASFLSGTSGISYNSTTGVISYSGTVYTDASIRALFSGSTGITYNSSTGAISYSGTVYTDSSIRALISLTTTGNSGASTYNNTTGVINVPEYTLAGLGGISLTSLSGGTGITYNNTTGAISYSGTVYTDASVRALISASGAVSYNNTTGVISLTSGNLTEATSSVLTITGGTGAVLGSGTSIQVKQATTSVSGFLSSTDWNTFNQKASISSGTTNYVAKFTSSTAIGNSIIFDNGTSVGINNTSPTSPLDVIANNSTAIHLRLRGRALDSVGQMEFWNNAQSTRYGYIAADSNNISIFTTQAIPLVFGTNTTTRLTIASTGAATFSNNLTVQGGDLDLNNGTVLHRITNDNTNLLIRADYGNTSASSTIQFSIDGAERMRITSGGNLLVGTTTDGGYKLTVAGVINTTNTTGYLLRDNDVAGYGIFKGASTRIGIAANGNEYLSVLSTGNVGIGTTSPATLLHVNGSITVGTGGNLRLSSNSNEGEFVAAFGKGMKFYTNDGNSNPINLTSGGNILMGTSSDNGERLYVSGAIRATGTITANSDITLKKNLLKIENALEKVEQINGYTYEFKADDSKRHAGVIAQEIQTVLPEIVNKGNDGILGVEYGNISALLIEATKEQQKQIKAQQIQINELKALLNK